MNRRAFVAGLGAVLAAPVATGAQQINMYRIGFLAAANPRTAPYFQAFEQRLRELGYVEGQNLVIEFRNAEGRLDRFPALAADLVRLHVNVIVVAALDATRAAKQATTALPIVMVAVNYDPVALGFVASLARPGGNVTGLFFLHFDLTAKRFALFKEMLPTINRVAVLSDAFTVDQLRILEAANRSLGLKLQPLELRNPPDLEDAFRVVTRSRAEGLFVLESGHIYRARIRNRAARPEQPAAHELRFPRIRGCWWTRRLRSELLRHVSARR